jgi:hypothetical protein
MGGLKEKNVILRFQKKTTKNKDMKIPALTFAMITVTFALIVSCSSRNSKDEDLAPNVHKITAAEVIQGSNYTYVRASSDGDDYWLAVEKADIKEGETYYWSQGAEMQEFTSKELKRTFRTIWFIQDLTDKPIKKQDKMPKLTSMAGKQEAPEKPGIKVPAVVGGMTIADMYKNEGSLAGKKVKVSGEVIRFSKEIMKKNWVHLQDGTKENGKYDLTITTLDSVKVGDIVVFEGTMAVKKDVGAGYFYELLLEDAKLVK